MRGGGEEAQGGGGDLLKKLVMLPGICHVSLALADLYELW